LNLLFSDPSNRIEANDEDLEQEYECLDRCIGELTPANRELILEYYREEKQAMIDNRKRMAESLGITLNALRVRADRIRSNLEKCVINCLKRESTNEE
jgi:DNA-directed RNA polymerase specialized sigma24 family protein